MGLSLANEQYYTGMLRGMHIMQDAALNGMQSMDVDKREVFKMVSELVGWSMMMETISKDETS
jgi:hypothetical protein